jgi:predicted regulator of amino acid metabolism with ACT domain
MISFFHTSMDQLCEPLEVNRKFIKMIDEVIQPEYERVLQDIFDLLKQDIDLKSTTTILGFSVET